MKPQTTARPRTPSLRSAAGRCVWGSVALRRNQDGGQLGRVALRRNQRRTTMQLGNGTTRAYSYDANSRLTTQIELNGATQLVTIVDSYDPVGNRIGRNLDGVLTTWTYDDLYRLTHQNKSGQVCTYVLDPVGNLEVMWEGGANPKTFTFDAADRLETMVEGTGTTTFTYTAFGALHTEHSRTGRVTNTYDGQDQLIKVQVSGLPGSVSTYTFDGDGMRRTAQEGNVQPTTMVWDGSDYLFLDGPSSEQLVLTLGGEIVACGAKDLLTDPLGTLVREIASGASLSGAFSFAPYGTPLSGTPTIPFRYIGAYGYFFDTKDLDYVRARELEKRLGRWMQTDPLWPGERAFGYVGARPVSAVDPFGLMATCQAPNDCSKLRGLDGSCISLACSFKAVHELTQWWKRFKKLAAASGLLTNKELLDLAGIVNKLGKELGKPISPEECCRKVTKIKNGGGSPHENTLEYLIWELCKQLRKKKPHLKCALTTTNDDDCENCCKRDYPEDEYGTPAEGFRECWTACLWASVK